MRMLPSFAAMILSTVAANLLLKSGSLAPGAAAGQWLALVNWRVAAGLASFALGAAFYVVILTKLPLNVAQSFAAFQFVAVILAAWLVLGEPIGPMRAAGMVLICGGIFLVGVSCS
jgi:drug/metabolite transporter (DMT)-like permease